MLIKVKVFSHSNKRGIVKKSENDFEVRVKVKPLRGQANKEAIKILAEYFEVSESNIRLVKGFRHTNKVFAISEIK